MLKINPVQFNNVKPIAFGEGNLNNIKKDYGRVNLLLKTEEGYYLGFDCKTTFAWHKRITKSRNTIIHF